MMGPSDLYRVPVIRKPTQREELLRYARLEYAASDLSWATPASRPSGPHQTGVRAWLSARLGTLRARVSSAQPAALRPGLAAVRFGGEASARIPARSTHTEAEHPCDVLATSALILTHPPDQPESDETCTCEP